MHAGLIELERIISQGDDENDKNRNGGCGHCQMNAVNDQTSQSWRESGVKVKANV